jgi:hypothetical protein
MKSKISFLFLISLFSLASAHANTRKEWKLGLYGRSTDDTLSSSRMVGPYALMRLQHKFTPDFEANLEGGLRVEVGSSSSLFTNEFEPKSKFLLSEASFTWRMLGPFSIRAGALNQAHHESPLLVDGGTFPAAIAALDFRGTAWHFHLDGQAAIPTSQNLSSKSVGKEPTANLLTQKAILGYDDQEWMFKLRASHFEFRNLTRGIAQDSRFYGNTVLGITNSARFFYDYEGYEAGGDIRIPLESQLSWTLGSSLVLNRRGPKNADEGRYFYSKFTWQDDDIKITPSVEWYRNEADSAPAFYTSSEYGHNNRRGLGAGLKLELLTLGFNIDLSYRRSKLIQPQTFQRDRFTFWQLSFEIPYEKF